MPAWFACPECGSEVALAGHAPGRRVRCVQCSTLVEVPFFPRAPKTTRKRQPWHPVFVPGLAAILVSCIALLGWWFVYSLRSRGAIERDRKIAAWVATAESAERSGQFDVAFEHLDRALRSVHDAPHSPYAGLEDLHRRRDAIAARDVAQRLESASQAPAQNGVELIQLLLARVDSDPSLEAVRPAVLEALEHARLNAASVAMAAASQAWTRGDAAASVAACERVLATLDPNASDRASTLVKQAEDLARKLAVRWGVVIEPLHGQYLRGSNASYGALLGSLVAEGLKSRGYVVQPLQPDLRGLWERDALYRARIEIREREEGKYLQSVYPLIRINVQMELRRAGMPFGTMSVSARTRTPIPGLSAFEAGRVASAPKRSPEGYKRVYDDAVAGLRESFAGKLRTLTPPAAPGS